MKNRFISERYRELKKTAMSQSCAAALSGDVINLSLGDPDINTHEDIIKAAYEEALSRIERMNMFGRK